MKDSKGFKRLKGLVAAGALGITGMAGGGSARAATVSTGATVTRGPAVWTAIGNNTSAPSSSAITTTNGDFYAAQTNAFGIADGSLVVGSSTVSDAFDNALMLAVDGNLFIHPDGDFDLTGDTITSDVVTNIVPGINAQIRYTFFSSRPTVRGLFTLTNTTGSPINVNAVVMSDYGSDTSTTVRATSDGDTVIENSDFWYITDEDSNDPRITTTRYGLGASVVPRNAVTPDGTAPAIAFSALRYPVSVPANGQVNILVFMEMGDPFISEAGQVAAAAAYESLDALDAAGLTVGLTQAQRDSLVNYGAAGGQVNVRPVPLFAPIGMIGLIGLVGGLGFFQLRRRKPA